MYPYRSATFTDERLLELIQNEDNRVAFEEIYHRYWQLLVDTAYRRLKSIEAAEEITQDIFVSLFLKRKSVEIKITLAGYLKTAVKYKVLNYIRTQQVQYNFETQMKNELRFEYVTPHHTLQAKELSQKIKESTAALPEKCREVFMLSRFEKLPNKAIALRLGISVSTVEKHISKAMRIMNEHFGDYKLELLITFYLLQS